MLKRVYEYYSYRISKFYKEKLKANNPYYFANAIFFSAINFIVLTLIAIVLIIFDIEWNSKVLIIFGIEWNSKWIYWISAIIIMSGIFWEIDEDKYQKLVEKYKDEKHSNLKGWLIFLSLIGSFALWVTTCYIKNKVIR